MFIGMIAFSYRVGLESIWMAIACILGDLTAWLLLFGIPATVWRVPSSG